MMPNTGHGESAEPDDGPPFAERLRFLFDRVHPRDRRPYTQTEVVDIIRRNGGKMTTGYLSQLLSGKRQCPSLDTVNDIIAAFGVPLDFFGPRKSYEEIRSYIEWMASVRDSGVKHVANRAYDPTRVFEVGFAELRRTSGGED
ncbi:helix-turn-helix domain-containing protein [Nocardia brasiliensis]|uniref:helix-turn-helix domain-containing protein n=1 Tax=Nocardia brasiliensis TaxID=37326 RepID=UPI0024576C59|nr:helix-turn-helix transcriptional regulator [Nocardia brasiliensis]